MMRLIAAFILSLVLLAELAQAAPQKMPGNAVAVVQSRAVTLPEGRVTLDGKPLFTVKVTVLSFSPRDRALAISARLAKLANDPLFRADRLKVLEGEGSSDIVCGDLILMSVTDADAQAAGKERSALAQEFSASMRATVEARNREYSTRSLLFGALYTLLATLVLIASLMALNRLVPKIIDTIDSWRGTHLRSIRFQSIELLNEQRMVDGISFAVRGSRTLLLLGLLYLYIPLVLTFFPWTRGMAATLFDYILDPVQKVGLAVLSYLPKIFFLVVIGAATHYAIRLVRFFFSEVEKRTVTIPGFYPDWAEPSFKIARFLMIAFAGVVAFPYLPGSDSPAFKGVSVFLGVLLSLGSSSAVANIVAGVILTYMRAFKLGDRVKIADTVGDVVEKTLLITRVRSIKNVDVTIPNALVLGSHITNFSSSAQEYGLILNTTVTIGYDAPWRQVHELLIAAARATENTLELPAPFVFQTGLDDFYVSYEINVYTDKPSVMARTYSELHQNIQEKFNEAGVEIMSPHYSSLRDGNRTTVPGEYLPASYRSPAFKFEKAEAAHKAGVQERGES